MYSADDALRDASTLFTSSDWWEQDAAYERLQEYLYEQRRKEGIPELLRGG